MKKAIVIFGTRPEVIKMAPVISALSQSKKVKPLLVATAQHRQLLDQVLGFFALKPDIDLNLMKPNQDLFDVTTGVLSGLKTVFQKEKPDVVLVQGDTTTTMAAALAAFYLKIPVGHVEAGLRTGERYSPFPEEMNRRLATPLASFHFAPTERSVSNLIRESIAKQTVFLTGNTSVDALLWAKDRAEASSNLKALFTGKRLILMTAHRRENFGAPLRSIFQTVRKFLEKHPEFHMVYPVHPNPNVREAADATLKGARGISLIDPLGYSELVYLMKECDFILTDSGGIQEEAPSLGKPVLVLRESTERPEAVEAGTAKLVGSNSQKLEEWMEKLSDKTSEAFQAMKVSKSPFGDGTAGRRITEILEKSL